VTAQVTHLALDGSRLDIEGDLDLSLPFTSVVDLGIGGGRHEFTAGALGLGDEVVAALGLSGFGEELSYAGGTLRIAHGKVTDPRTRLADAVTVAAWHGTRHSLVSSLYNVTTADVLDLFSAVRITEQDAGITLAPAPDSGSTLLGGALVLKEVPGLGLLEIAARSREAVRELPDWGGLALPSGELFRDTLSNGRPYFVLATPAAIVTVLPLGDRPTADEAARVSGLSVSVRSARPW